MQSFLQDLSRLHELEIMIWLKTVGTLFLLSIKSCSFNLLHEGPQWFAYLKRNVGPLSFRRHQIQSLQTFLFSVIENIQCEDKWADWLTTVGSSMKGHSGEMCLLSRQDTLSAANLCKCLLFFGFTWWCASLSVFDRMQTFTNGINFYFLLRQLVELTGCSVSFVCVLGSTYGRRWSLLQEIFISMKQNNSQLLDHCAKVTWTAKKIARLTFHHVSK